VLATACATTSACTYATIGSGEVGVVWTPDGVEKKVYSEGSWHIGVYDKATVYNARSQEREEQLEVLAANGLRIEMDASVRYHIDPEQVVALDHDLGVHYYSILIGPTVRSQARRVVGRYQPEEIYSTQREMIERLIREGVEKAIETRHIVLEAVLIRNVKLPEPIQRAINDKLEAEQKALKMKFVIAEAKAENEKKMLEAQAEAERRKVEAQATADTDEILAKSKAKQKKVEADAVDDYNKTVDKHLTEKVLEWERIKAQRDLAGAPSSKTVIVGGKATPVVEVQ
jgi:regulator of protease activity HflC (stomatin/prohibitin superfamily)